MATAALADSREQLWEAVFDTFYDSAYEDMVADALISRWSSFNDIATLLVALTASGSAVAGWAVWGNPGFKTLWAMISGFAALLSIAHSTLGTSSRIKVQAESKRRFASLRTDLETFRYKMRLEPEFNMATYTKQFEEFRKRYSDNVQVLPNDILRTSKLEKQTQDKLNARLGNEIQH